MSRIPSDPIPVQGLSPVKEGFYRLGVLANLYVKNILMMWVKRPVKNRQGYIFIFAQCLFYLA